MRRVQALMPLVTVGGDARRASVAATSEARVTVTPRAGGGPGLSPEGRLGPRHGSRWAGLLRYDQRSGTRIGGGSDGPHRHGDSGQRSTAVREPESRSDPSQLPRLATGRVAVTNGYSHRMFC